jgi:hypothetical protein
MFSSTIAKAAVLLTLLAGPALAWGGGAAPPQPSHSSCTYSCPESDQGQYGVHEPSCGKEGNNMICAYPSQKLGPNDYNRDATCTYDAVRRLLPVRPTPHAHASALHSRRASS